MERKINHQFFIYPPYISTSWQYISSLFQENDSLIVLLRNGSRVAIPSIDPPTLEQIFQSHREFLEIDENRSSSLQETLDQKLGNTKGSTAASRISIPLLQIDGESDPSHLDSNPLTGGLGAAIQHNPKQSNAPDIPPQILTKLSAIAKILGPHSLEEWALPEPHCNCPYCQIIRALRRPLEEKNVEEPISESDLHFRLWNIEQTGDHLYTVSNPNDPNERYSVHLGTPIGCTCGQKNCEHVRAVLNS